ncbi:TAXI family TRAP transporter solute-binding subunit [Glutamicibacter sp. 0426]|uniref:TAXI family TRAP transporter solute-binding subunit n=1 Tax=Glutamicibacter sp. 0426 TaxID=1913445 RepID=UPI00093E601A|nr:TAXI family TRAP transporter solute-binding subunit [Glutamicibacter sp. 0426]
MPRAFTRRSFLTGLSATAALGALSACARSAVAVPGLPHQTVWSTYGVGTGTYNDVAAIANTLTQQVGMQVRLMTSDTGIGRLAPLINGTAHYSRTGDEYYYAFEGDDEYASEVWGPQPLRLVMSPPGNYGILVRKDSGIKKVEDLAGKRFPRLVASTSMNRKLEGILNYGGLTTDDVILVDVAYSEQIEAIKTGQIDTMYQNVVGANVSELASQYPIRWMDLGGNDPSKYATWEDLSPMMIPGSFTDGAGMKPGESAVNLQYSLPLVTLADRPAQEVQTLLASMDKHYDKFKDATPDAHKFGADEVMLTPMVIPMHEGSVAFFKQAGRWTADLEKRNQALLEREQLLAQAWPDFWSKYSGEPDIAERWRKWKKQNFPKLPAVNDVPTDSASTSA